jgi:hypothetical protein
MTNILACPVDFFVSTFVILQLIFDCACLDIHVTLFNFKLHEIYAIHRFHYNLHVFVCCIDY